MQKYLVIGYPVGHSRSPGMQNAAFEYHKLGRPYGMEEVAPEKLAEFVKRAAGSLAGFNATVPHKEALIPLMDEIDPAAKLAGSVNTVKIENGRLCGSSTDGIGLQRALEYNFGAGGRVRDNSFLFLGAGGAARATAFHLAANGAKKIVIANRTIERAETLAGEISAAFSDVEISTVLLNSAKALAAALDDARVLLQCTSLGLRDGDPAPLPLELLRPGMDIAVFDAIYRDTPILRHCRQQGIPAADGSEMLVQQGAASFESWTGLAAPVEMMRLGMVKGDIPLAALQDKGAL